MALCDMMRSAYNESGGSGGHKLPPGLSTSDTDAWSSCEVSHPERDFDPLCEVCGC